MFIQPVTGRQILYASKFKALIGNNFSMVEYIFQRIKTLWKKVKMLATRISSLFRQCFQMPICTIYYVCLIKGFKENGLSMIF